MISAYNSYNEPYQIICIPASTLLPAHSPHLPLKVSYFTTSRFDIFARQSESCSEWRPQSSSERRTREATWSSLWSAARWVFHSLISAIKSKISIRKLFRCDILDQEYHRDNRTCQMLTQPASGSATRVTPMSLSGSSKAKLSRGHFLPVCSFA